MKERLKNSLKIAKEKYCEFVSARVDNFHDDGGFKHQIRQIDIFTEIILEYFESDEANLIETGVSGDLSYGMFGFFLGSFVENFGGRMESVDINCESCKSSKDIFNRELPNLKYNTHCQDSITFLERPTIIPNIIHLDSYDFQLFDPFPSAIHTWKEFTSIKKLLPKKSIVLIDDNWLKGTHLQWFQNGNEYLEEIKFPIIGKGAHIYQEIITDNREFEFIGNHHLPYKNIKIYLKKK